MRQLIGDSIAKNIILKGDLLKGILISCEMSRRDKTVLENMKTFNNYNRRARETLI